MDTLLYATMAKGRYTITICRYIVIIVLAATNQHTRIDSVHAVHFVQMLVAVHLLDYVVYAKR